LLFTAQEYGFTPVGVDLRRENAQRMADFGVRTYSEDISTLSLDFQCAVVSMADVLEHLPFPRTGLKSANRLLRDGGVLFVSMPNMESTVWRALDDNKANPYWAELEHYHNFSRSRLYELLRECGFEPLRYGISERYRACMEIVARKR
jgi:2-polyprenyl-3-methyl-5-hydroxy-6-metoxy-1,4-benzoquinol methylase